MQTMTRTRVLTGLYTLEYRTAHERTVRTTLQPTIEQIRNSEVMAETYEGSGIMKGRLLTGKDIHVRMDRIVTCEPMGVSSNES